MSPMPYSNFPTQPTLNGFEISASSHVPIDSTNSNIHYQNCIYFEPKKTETKKERLIRISKERMLASWKTHNQKTETIIQVKQFCKPRHKINIPRR